MLQRGGLAVGTVAVLILAGMLLGTIVDLLLGIMPQPFVDPGFFVGYLFMGALTLAGTVLFRHPLGGMALAVVYWLIDLRMGVAANPFLTLHATAERLEGNTNLLTELLNKPLLLAVAAGMIAWCAAAAPRLVRSFDRRELPRPAAVLVGLFFVLLMVQAVAAVGMIYLSRVPPTPPKRTVQSLSGGRRVSEPASRPSTLRTIGAPLEKFKPLPLSLLFGPVYHGLLSLPPENAAGGVETGIESQFAAKGGGTPDGAVPRVAALARLVRDYGSWPWADTAAYELAVSRSAIDGVAGVNDFKNLAERYPNSPYAPYALASIMTGTEVWIITDKRPDSRSQGPYERYLETMPLQPRLSAALALVERYPNYPSAADARAMLLQYYPALIRPNAIAPAAKRAVETTRGDEKAHWLAILAEIDVNGGRFEAAEKELKQAREAGGRDGVGADADDSHVSVHLDRVEMMLNTWRKQQQGGGK
jgi:hypothetical protein